MILLLVLSVASLAVIGGLAWAHLMLRATQGPLPDLLSLPLPSAGPDGPISVSYINTASQAMPRSAVLDPTADPFPDAPYIMSHPAFVLRWADGRILLIDTGMTTDAASSFGRTLEWMAGAEPVRPLAQVADALGPRVDAISGILFTHLHTDHVDGLIALCAKRRDPLMIYMTTAQAHYSNHTTQPGRMLIAEAGCARVEELGDGTLVAVPGFPGVSVFAAGGHTPGSQVILAAVQTPQGTRPYAFVGDIVNNIDGINHNISKPPLYSLLVVPEDDARLAALRVLLRLLRDDRGATVLAAHDQRALEASGVEPYSP